MSSQSVFRNRFFLPRHSEIRNLQSAILLVGPTGSGKTPLGKFLEREGFRGHRYVHFDFGANLRRIAEMPARPSWLSVSAFRVVRRVIKSGALLAENEFHIATAILSEFMRRKHMRDGDMLVLNGLPRHKGQAECINAIVTVKLVVNLRCSADVVMARIKADSGGDRKGRIDDSPAFVARKLKIFRARTLPLLDHYRRKRVRVVNVVVTEESTPDSIISALSHKYGDVYKGTPSPVPNGTTSPLKGEVSFESKIPLP